jgi:hypothetical protein
MVECHLILNANYIRKKSYGIFIVKAEFLSFRLSICISTVCVCTVSCASVTFHIPASKGLSLGKHYHLIQKAVENCFMRTLN